MASVKYIYINTVGVILVGSKADIKVYEAMKVSSLLRDGESYIMAIEQF